MSLVMKITKSVMSFVPKIYVLSVGIFTALIANFLIRFHEEDRMSLSVLPHNARVGM